jgi:hypothetical protein
MKIFRFIFMRNIGNINYRVVCQEGNSMKQRTNQQLKGCDLSIIYNL